MAQKDTVFKVRITISDLDRHLYPTASLTVAQHPSETDERLMVRILALIINWHEDMHFGQGLCDEHEADVWQKTLTDDIVHWIDVGLPSEELIRKACNRSEQMTVYAYGTDNQVNPWWQKLKGKIGRFDNLKIYQLPEAQSKALAEFARHGMHLQATLEDGEIWLSDEENTLQLTPTRLND